MTDSNTKPGLLSTVGSGITKIRNFTLNLGFILLLILIIVGALSTCQTNEVPTGSALLFNPSGTVVEARSYPGQLQDLLTGANPNQEVELGALLAAISMAANDDKIKLLILDLEQLTGITPAHASRLGQSIQAFQSSGKKVVSYGDYYSQAQYHLASYADAVYMHPMGQILLTGFGGNSLYFNDLLKKVNVNLHVFRVGEFKSAVEPYTRNSMSKESRMASEILYNDLWQHYLRNVSTNRLVNDHDIQRYADDLPAIVKQTNGDLARAALEHKLVDELLTSDQVKVRLADEVGYADSTKQSLNAINLSTYLSTKQYSPDSVVAKQTIGIITVEGPIIVDGLQGQAAQANVITRLIAQARHNDDIRAVVLRVNSPGGSQFGSELIRQELELLQLTGKPVVASFGGAAASGGYWVSATADEIVSEATTITGSIGIFSLVATFERTLERLGIHSDGVGTTENTLGLDVLSGLNPNMSQVLQSRVNNGYEQFVDLVARGRDKTTQEIHKIAGGRVWSGEAALDLGLVDHLGGLQLAVERAAALVGLESWGVKHIAPQLDPRSAFIAQLLQDNASYLNIGTRVAEVSPINHLLQPLEQAAKRLSLYNDPGHIYVLCEVCSDLTFDQ